MYYQSVLYVEGRKEVFPWTVIGLLFLLWTVNCVLFSSWTVNWPPLIFSVIRELSSIIFVNRELESFIFPVIRDWPLFFFREPWILPIIFVNFPIFPPKSMSFIVMIRNWLLMIDICLLFSEMWRRSATISYQKLNYKCTNHGTMLTHRTSREITHAFLSKSQWFHIFHGAFIEWKCTPITNK